MGLSVSIGWVCFYVLCSMWGRFVACGVCALHIRVTPVLLAPGVEGLWPVTRDSTRFPSAQCQLLQAYLTSLHNSALHKIAFQRDLQFQWKGGCHKNG